MPNVGVFTVIRVLKAKVKQNSSVANLVHFFSDPVHFFPIQIRIHGSGFQNPDLDQVDPKKTGSGSYLDMFFMFSKINNCCMAFLYLI